MMRRRSDPARIASLVVGVAAVCALGLGFLALDASQPSQPVQGQAEGVSTLRKALARSDAPTKRHARVKRAGDVYLVVNLEFKKEDDCANFCKKAEGTGCHVFNHYHEFADVMLKPGDEAAAKLIDEAQPYWDIAGHVQIPPPPRPEKASAKGKGEPEKIVRGGIGDRKGKGVIVAVVDTGIDFRHPDFVTKGPDGKPRSRLLYLWDTLHAFDGKQGQPAPVKFPDGQPFGTVFTGDDLTRDLQDDKKTLGRTDGEGHGTACAGIAAGGGRASQDYTGVAPEADLIGVRVGTGPGFEHAFLINAVCAWLDGIANKRDNAPLVVSCSYGGQFGGRDGCLIEERQLTRRLDAARHGTILCIAAGNEGDLNIHAEAKFRKDEPATFIWEANAAGKLTIYIDGAKPDEVRVKPLDKTTRLGEITKDMKDISGSLVLTIELPQKGRHGLSLETTHGEELWADAYLPEWNKEKESIQFVGSAKNGHQIDTPAAAHGAIAVGSYDFNDQFHFNGRAIPVPNLRTKKGLDLGEVSDYSNAGYIRQRRREIVKPDITAPGRYHTAPAPENYEGDKDTSGKYQLFDGTSAATPYVAGVAALLLQEKRNMTVNEFRTLLRRCASRDEQTGDRLPNPQWGYGKLDYKAVERLIESR